MKCKICGSDNIIKDDSHYTCQSCGSVFYSAPEDDAPEVIKEAKEAIEAEEAEKAAKKAEEAEKAKLAEEAKRAKEAELAEEILKNSEKMNAPHETIEDIEDVKVVENIEDVKNIAKEDATQILENLGDEIKAPDKTQVFKNIEKTASEEDLGETKTLSEPLYVAEKMADVPVEEYEEQTAVEELIEENEEKPKKEKKAKKEEKTEDADGEKPVKKKSAMREILDFCLPIIIALIVAMLLKTFVFANAQVPTGSMLNTIQEGDRIIASRIEYNFHEPERYDIVIFKFPDDVAAHEKDPSVEVEYFVKRIIGLPGETVTIVNGVVYVTDKDGKSEQLKDDFVTACTPTGNYGPYKVPEDSYFVMGDNRESSIDSRFWTTTNYVKKDLFVGKVKFRYYPSIGKVE